MADRTNVVIGFLVVLVVVLAGILLYTLVIKPSISGYAVKYQQQGVQIAVSAILTQLQQNGFVQIPLGNQTLYLAPVNPQQPPQ